FLASTRFFLLFRLGCAYGGASLPCWPEKPHLFPLHNLPLGDVQHSVDLGDRELAHKRVVRDLVNRAARQDLAVRAGDEVADAPLCRHPLLGLPEPELDLDTDRLESGRD